MKPVFKGKEVVVEKHEENSASLSSDQVIKAKVAYVGEQQNVYKVGDTILYFNTNSPNIRRDLDYFEQKLTILAEDRYVICQVEE